jgi:hypothetical protein
MGSCFGDETPSSDPPLVARAAVVVCWSAVAEGGWPCLGAAGKGPTAFHATGVCRGGAVPIRYVCRKPGWGNTCDRGCGPRTTLAAHGSMRPGQEGHRIRSGWLRRAERDLVRRRVRVLCNSAGARGRGERVAVLAPHTHVPHVTTAGQRFYIRRPFAWPPLGKGARRPGSRPTRAAQCRRQQWEGIGERKGPLRMRDTVLRSRAAHASQPRSGATRRRGNATTLLLRAPASFLASPPDTHAGTQLVVPTRQP